MTRHHAAALVHSESASYLPLASPICPVGRKGDFLWKFMVVDPVIAKRRGEFAPASAENTGLLSGNLETHRGDDTVEELGADRGRAQHLDVLVHHDLAALQRNVGRRADGVYDVGFGD